MKKMTVFLMTLLCIFCIFPMDANATTGQKTSLSANDIIPNDETGIPDEGLYKAILRVLHKGEDETFTKEEAESIKWFDTYKTAGDLTLYVPIKSLKGIGYLKNLITIDMEYFEGTTLEGIEELEKLYKLWIYQSKIENLDSLTQCKELDNVTITFANLKSLSGKGTFSNLRSLDIGNNKLSSLSGMNRFPKLEVLVVDNNKLKSLKGIGSLKKLRYLSANNNKLTNISAVQYLKNLVSLEVGYNKLTNINAVTKLSKLKGLDVSCNQLRSIPKLNKLKKMKISGLDLKYNRLSEKEIRQKLPKKFTTDGGKEKKNWLKDQIKTQNCNAKLKMISPSSLNKITIKTKKIKGKTLPNARIYLHVGAYATEGGDTIADENGYFELEPYFYDYQAGGTAELMIEVKKPGSKKWEDLPWVYKFVIKNK